jgi:hypothetical protein
MRREVYWSAFIVMAWILLLGTGRIEGKVFPAAADLKITRIEAVEKIHIRDTRTEFPNTGPYTAIWVQFNKLRDNPPWYHCDPEHLEWFYGKRGKKSSRINRYSWGKPEVRDGGINTAGPWTVGISPERFHNTYMDALHQCYTFGIPHIDLTRTPLWN